MILPFGTSGGSSGGGVTSFNTRTGAVVPASADYAVAQVTGAAPLASPALTGTPTAPTATALTNNTQLATTAYVDSAAAVVQASNGILHRQITLTPTQVKALRNTQAASIVIIPAPGAGKLIFPVASFVNLQFATTPYATGTGNLGTYYSDGVSVLTQIATLIFPAAAMVLSNSGVNGLNNGSAPQNTSNPINSNQAVALSLSTATGYTAGDSPIVVDIWYRIMSVA